MKNDGIRRLPPPPLFTIRPPPKPPGSMFENFDTVKIFNGQCIRTSIDVLSSSSSSSSSPITDQSMTWLNIFLLILVVICVICCIIIVIFIFICLKKLKKEEKQYKDYLTSGSLSLKSHRHHHMTTCTRTSEHYKCTSNRFHCCDDYYSQQLMPMTHTSSSHQHINTLPVPSSINDSDTPQNHQYESIPEYLLTMTRHRHYQQHQFNSTCGGGTYSNFSRLYLTPQEVTTNTSDCSQCTCSPPPSMNANQEESSTPLLATRIPKESHRREELSSSSSSMIEWTKKSLFS